MARAKRGKKKVRAKATQKKKKGKKGRRAAAARRPKKRLPPKFLFVVGGVMSGVGKGVATASLGTILEGMGHRVNLVKADPYLNVDAGTMNPTEHGEVFVMDSGLETDQDMGNYERFLDRDLTGEDYMTSGMVYKAVIDRERTLGYGGKCVEAIPHVRDEILLRFEAAAKASRADVTIVEIGGTVGDFQNALFFDAAKAMKLKRPADVAFVLVSYLPVPGALGEMKTRPTQNAFNQLASYGIHADFVVARAAVPLDHRRKEKIAAATGIPVSHIISAPDVRSIYDVPLNFEKDRTGSEIAKALGLGNGGANLSRWKEFVRKSRTARREVRIAVVGKYFDTGDFVLADSYLSVIEALKYSAYWQGARPTLTWINSKKYDDDPRAVSELALFDGVVVPGGFGSSGIEGKIEAIRFCREEKIPYLGLCYGMQLMTIEFARNVAGLKGATTAEIDPEAKHLVIDVMPDQKEKIAAGNYGGSMRLGSYPCRLAPKSIAREAYSKFSVSERHRHRYEVNPEYVAELKESGLVFSGASPDGSLMEIAELPRDTHPFMLGTQFHPEFKARPLSPHPLFSAFLAAALSRAKEMIQERAVESGAVAVPGLAAEQVLEG
ncbi:MAG TPA: CTP synthase [Candidatus Paceibacterota bacterium]